MRIQDAPEGQRYHEGCYHCDGCGDWQRRCWLFAGRIYCLACSLRLRPAEMSQRAELANQLARCLVEHARSRRLG